MSSWYFIDELLPGRLYGICEAAHFEKVCAYLALSTTGAVLIDTGMGYGDLVAEVIRPIVGSRPVTVVLTHAHHDHIGGHEAFDEVLVFDNSWERQRLAQGFSSVDIPDFMDPDCFDRPYEPRVYAVAGRSDPTLIAEEGELTVNGLTMVVVATPGHTPGSISVLLPELKAAAVGDLVYPGPLFAHFPESDPAAFSDSVVRLRARVSDYEILLPGHNATSAPIALLDDAAAVFRNWMRDQGRHRLYSAGAISLRVRDAHGLVG